MLMLAAAGLAAHRGVGARGDFPADVEAVAAFGYDYRTAYRSGSCFVGAARDASAFGDCDGDGEVVLWGDSHAAHLYPGVRAFAPAAAQFTKAGCPPIVDADLGSRHCRAVNDAVLARIRRMRPARVILAGAWHVHDWRRVRGTIIALRSIGVHRIDLVGPFPEWTHGLPRTMMSAIRRDPTDVPRRLATGWDPNVTRLDEEMRAFAAQAGADYTSPFSTLCDARGCLARLDDDAASLVAWDESHLTTGASTLIAERLLSPDRR